MNIYEQIVSEIMASKSIVITSHKSPDGDSVGCSLGLLSFIQRLGKPAVICHPDPAPGFLSWLPGLEKIKEMTHHKAEIEKEFEHADLIFCLDYNATDRVGEDMQVLLERSQAKKIMIDHHLNPQDFASIRVSETEVCSTSQLIAELVEQSGNLNLLNEAIGTPLYLGILTDTGTFRFPSVQPRTHQILANLLAAGVKHHLIHENLNDTNTEGRLRLQGYAMFQKLEILHPYSVAIIPLTEEEHIKFNYQKGDTDGIPNTALSIKGMKVAILLSERDGMIKISFRSKGKENPVNVLAAEHFEGGGHANAAGGKSMLSMNETLDKLKRLIPMYFQAAATSIPA
ncbi:MAG: DHH family phosphoesterase [Cytophagales bacterium]|nr:DHH family phosphoesterase [Cytophagales bacterium]